MVTRPGKTYNVTQLFTGAEVAKIRKMPPGALVEYQGAMLEKVGINKLMHKENDSVGQ